KIMAQTNALGMNLWLINVGLFGVALVVTVLIAKQITGELREAQEKLLRQERLATLGQLGAGIGHELRNPLGAIKNAAYFLQMVFEKPAPEVKETIDIIAKEVATSERIISSLLSYARPKPATRRKVNINDVIVEALSASSLPETVEVVSQMDEGIPTMLADPDQLRQVFVNLILNALQAMPKGGRLIVKSWSPRPDSVNVSIADTGVGIPQADLDKIFKPLFTTKAKGIGLGLAIVKTLVDGHDGTIDVQSEPDKGTTFTVRIPVVLRVAE
ncbi:MAG: ATP-binding protein, partial [Candidatus Thorarchaeota archaeon]